MRKTRALENKQRVQPLPARTARVRRTRIRLFALLVLTGLFAAGVLFVKFKLETLRGNVQSVAGELMGGDLQLGSVQVYGLRGLHIADFAIEASAPGGPSIRVEAPEALLIIDLVDLFYGRVTIDRVQLDDADIVVTRPMGADWFGTDLTSMLTATGVGPQFSFRVLGRDCRLRIQNVVGDTRLQIEDLDIDVSRLPESTELTARASGQLDGRRDGGIRANLRYASLDDFDLRVEHDRLSAADINVFLPAQQQFITSGDATPRLRIAGYPNRLLVVSLESNFRDISLRNQPELLAPATGRIEALASFDGNEDRLELTTADIVTDQFSGRIDGNVDFASVFPGLDLRVQLDRIPVLQIMDYLFQGRTGDFGTLDVDIEDAYALNLRLGGTTDDPAITAEAQVSSGTVSLDPASPQYPAAALQVGMMQVTWDSQRGQPQGRLNIVGGSIRHAASGLVAEDVTGAIRLEDNQLVFDPLNAKVTGYPLTGNARFNLDDRSTQFDVSGTAAQLEKLRLLEGIEDISLAGAAAFRCKAQINPNHYVFDVGIDATQAEIGYEWWFRKPLGLGCGATALTIEMTPGKHIQIAGSVNVNAIPIQAVVEVGRHAGAWGLDSIRVKSDHVDADTASRCLQIPYRLEGGAATEGVFDWKRAGDIPKGNIFELAGHIDGVRAFPRGGTTPIALNDAQVRVVVDSSTEHLTGAVNIQGGAGALAPLNEPNFLPIRPDDPELAAAYPAKPRDWAYAVALDAMQLPPWEGTAFTAEVHTTEGQTRVDSFAANVGDGSLSGSFSQENAGNVMKLDAQWNEVPAVYFMRYLGIPELATGNMTGNIAYTLDQDDPSGTLQGEGMFDIHDGRFSADFLAAQLQDKLEGDLSSLPPSLAFEQFHADVKLEGDRIVTENVLLSSSGITIAGNGNFIIDGDMDYNLNVAVSPATAERMPLLRDNFNIQGHQLSQSNIDLAFHINGPTFRPRGRVAGLPPVGVTLVSGAFEVTTEIIDLPRQILIDLFKIGGGLVGPGR